MAIPNGLSSLSGFKSTEDNKESHKTTATNSLKNIKIYSIWDCSKEIHVQTLNILQSTSFTMNANETTTDVEQTNVMNKPDNVVIRHQNGGGKEGIPALGKQTTNATRSKIIASYQYILTGLKNVRLPCYSFSPITHHFSLT